MTTKFETSACVLVATIPTRKPARSAAASAASTTRRLPSRPINTSGVSTGGAAAPRFLLTRSVGQVERKSETTLGIAGLQLKICAFAGATADNLDAPSGASHAGNRQRRRREEADAPARDGSRQIGRADV